MDKRTIDKVRDYYSLPDSVTDEQISASLKNSIGATAANISIAAQDLKKAFAVSVPKVFRKHYKK